MKSTCEFCKAEFETEGKLLRHISNKEICKDHYGEAQLKEMRKKGRQNAVKKWKLANSDYYAKNKYGAKSIPKSNTNCFIRPTSRCGTKRNYERYSYVPVPIRKETEDGKDFSNFFTMIFERKRRECLEKFKDVAKEKVLNVAIDMTLNDINSDIDDVPGKYHSLVTYANAPHDFMFDQWHGWDDNHQSAYDKFEKQIEIVFEDEFKKKLDQCISRWIESVEYKMKKYCYKENENWSFCNFFERFSEEIPKLRKQAVEAEELIDFDEYDQKYFSKAFDFRDLQWRYFKRRRENVSQIFQELLSKMSMESEIAKPMEKRIDDELLQFVGYAKTKDVDSVGSIKIK